MEEFRKKWIEIYGEYKSFIYFAKGDLLSRQEKDDFYRLIWKLQ